MGLVLPMGFSPGQVRCGFSVTKEIDSKTFFGVKGFVPVLPMDFSPGQVCYGFNVTKGIDSKTFFGMKGFIIQLVLQWWVEH